ncbi:MAG TPA: zf-HC2 domain-containing protein [Bacteroidota bacterium]
MRHSKIKLMLYEFVRSELPQEEMAEVESHLCFCEQCAREAEGIREIVNLTAAAGSTPSAGRSPEYWNKFAYSVESRIRAIGSRAKRRPVTILDDLAAFFTLRPRALAIVGSSLALVVLAVLVSRNTRPRPENPEQSSNIEAAPVQPVLAENKIGDYFRRSKVLLVGITHLKADDDQPIDLSSESKVSRELLDDARYLRNQPLDLRSAKLIDDLQKILVELANIKEHEALPNVDIIRSGIHRENLLFKIRMAEASCDSTRFVPVRDTY